MYLDQLIFNAIIVTVNDRFDIFDDGALGIKDGKIAYVGEKPSNINFFNAAEIIDAGGGVVLPGLINTHTHLPMTLFRGLADDLPLDQWLNEYIFPSEANHISSETAYWGALLACGEMMLSGTTTCCDGYFYESQVAAAVFQSGMRGVLGHGIVDFPAPGVPDPLKNVQTADQYIQKWHGKTEFIKPSIFCHSPYTCSKDTLKNAKAVAQQTGVLFQIHASETRQEVETCIKRHGFSPIGYLNHIGVLDNQTLLAHCVWIDDADLDIIAKTGAFVSHVPESNMKLGSGTAPVNQMISANIPVGLGTDGCASNNTLDMFRTMNVTAKLHKVCNLDPTVMNAKTILKMATINGAAAIGLKSEIGSLEIGKAADILIIDKRKPHLVPMYSPVSHLVYAVSGADVRHVFIGGQQVVKDRNLLTLDLDEIIEKIIAFAGVISHDTN
jgi:5-methylthioadenosine/S-adenosylhomocysteine deaminase